MKKQNFQTMMNIIPLLIPLKILRKMKLRKRNIILETQLKINERDFEKIENIEQENKHEMKRNLITDP